MVPKAWIRWGAATALAVVAAGCLSRDPSLGLSRAVAQAESRSDAGQPLPFPVEGFGAGTRGGSGGAVLTVTNLNDRGPGSLRHAVRRSGPRIIRFAVAGTIDLRSDLEIDEPRVTIDGSDAPEGGITLRNASVIVETEHVVLRHIRIRPGRGVPDPGNGDAVNIKPGARHVVLDHVSLSWGTDEVLSIYGTDVTVQWSFVTEGLNCAGHPKGCHGKGLMVVGPATRVSILHTLVAHHADRNPFIRSENSQITHQYQLVNNVFYNYHIPTLIETLAPTGTVQFDFVGNYYKRGVNSPPWAPILIATRSLERFRGALSIHLRGNLGPQRNQDTDPEDLLLPLNRRQYAGPQRHFPPVADETDAVSAFKAVLSSAGATLPCRDAVDQRVAAEARTGSGRIIDDPSEVGGWPVLRCPK